MSGYTDDVIADNGVLENDLNFIEKPFTHNELSMILRKVLDEETILKMPCR
jgi:hypothetical protein